MSKFLKRTTLQTIVIVALLQYILFREMSGSWGSLAVSTNNNKNNPADSSWESKPAVEDPQEADSAPIEDKATLLIPPTALVEQQPPKRPKMPVKGSSLIPKTGPKKIKNGAKKNKGAGAKKKAKKIVFKPTIRLPDPYMPPDAPRIPKILHFVFVAPQLNVSRDAYPKDVLETIAGFEALHASDDWKITKWTNSMIREAFPDLIPLLLKIQRPMAWVANIVRYAILERHGGIYLDTDFDAIRPLDDLIERFSNFTVCELETNRDPGSMVLPPRPNPPLQNITIDMVSMCDQVSNAIIAVPPHNAAVQHVLETSIATTKRLLLNRPSGAQFPRYSLSYTGPPVWTESATLHGMTVLTDYTFFPCPWQMRGGDCVLKNTTKFEKLHKASSYAKHLWSISWRPHDPSAVELAKGVKINSKGYVSMT